jgi:hypothetical protein
VRRVGLHGGGLHGGVRKDLKKGLSVEVHEREESKGVRVKNM